MVQANSCARLRDARQLRGKHSTILLGGNLRNTLSQKHRLRRAGDSAPPSKLHLSHPPAKLVWRCRDAPGTIHHRSTGTFFRVAPDVSQASRISTGSNATRRNLRLNENYDRQSPHLTVFVEFAKALAKILYPTSYVLREVIGPAPPWESTHAKPPPATASLH